jgi:hypothetical protein
MRSLLEKKPLVFLLSILAVGALTVLAVGLRNVPFNDGQPIGQKEADTFSPPPQAVIVPEVSAKSQSLLWVSLIVLFILIALVLSPEGRRRMLRIIVRMAFIMWGIYFIFKRYPDAFSFLGRAFLTNQAAQQNAGDVSDLPPPVFTPPPETPWLSYLVSLLLVLGIVFLAWSLYRTWQMLNPGSMGGALTDIARIARSSLRDLSSGRESTDVIMNCYFRMSDVVADKKHLQRGSGMTPAEFAVRLEQAGLPGDSVRRLTRLFERVRYGEQKAGPKDVNEAVACLTAILQYCGEPV